MIIRSIATLLLEILLENKEQLFEFEELIYDCASIMKKSQRFPFLVFSYNLKNLK
jgi:hypothetical protein